MGNELVPQRQISGAMKVYDKILDPLQASKDLSQSFASIMGAPLDQGMAIALTALCEGLTPVDMRRRYHWIQGRPVVQAAAMLSEFRLNYGGEFVIDVDTCDESKITFTDNKGRVYPRSLTWKECEESRWPWNNWRDHSKGLKDNWATPLDRKAMIFSRNVSDSLKKICPELAAGVYTVEEMKDVYSMEGEFRVVAPKEDINPDAIIADAYKESPVVDADGSVQDAEFTPKPEVDEVKKAEAIKRVEELTKILKLTDSQIKKSLVNRGVKNFEELTLEQLLEMAVRMNEKVVSSRKKEETTTEKN